MSTLIATSKLVLVPSGPLCRQMLAAAGYAFRTVEPTTDEPVSLSPHVAPVAQAEALAYWRARKAAELCANSRVLALASLVVIDGRVFGRPADRREAAEMLRALSGRRHTVVTGAAALDGGCRLIASDVTGVWMLPIPAAAIEAHLASGDWLAAPGAYATREMARRFVLDLVGSPPNVPGLPMELVKRMLAKFRDRPREHPHIPTAA